MPIELNKVAADFHRHLCDCDTHGYTQGDSRWGDAWRGSCEVESNGRIGTFYKGDRDCSSSVIDAWQESLRGTPYEGCLSGATYTGNMRRVFTDSGLFEWGEYDYDRIWPGDILLNEVSHTAMYQTGLQLSEFCINEFGGITGGQSGDQTGRESWVHGFYDFPWDGVLYYNHKADIADPEPEKLWHDCCIWGSHGKANQKWLLNDQGDGSFEIESAEYPGSVLDVYEGKAESGTKVGIYPRNGGVNQRWVIQDGGIRSALGELWLDVKYATDTEGAEVEIYARNDSDAQKWVALEGSDGCYTILNNHKGAKRALDVIA